MPMMTLQEAIDYAVAPRAPVPYGIEVWGMLSMHDDGGAVLLGQPGFPNFTFRTNVPLLGGPQRIGSPTTPVPGFSTRGQGGMSLDVGLDSSATLTSTLIDFSVRRDPGHRFWRFLGFGPTVYMEIETLSAAGAVTGGVSLKADENGTLVRAVGPSVRDPNLQASYTFTIVVQPRIG